MPRRFLSNGSISFFTIVATLCFSPAFAVAEKRPAVDLVVYGGTASGVITAYSAAKEGLHVCPSRAPGAFGWDGDRRTFCD